MEFHDKHFLPLTVTDTLPLYVLTSLPSGMHLSENRKVMNKPIYVNMLQIQLYVVSNNILGKL